MEKQTVLSEQQESVLSAPKYEQCTALLQVGNCVLYVGVRLYSFCKGSLNNSSISESISTCLTCLEPKKVIVRVCETCTNPCGNAFLAASKRETV